MNFKLAYVVNGKHKFFYNFKMENRVKINSKEIYILNSH